MDFFYLFYDTALVTMPCMIKHWFMAAVAAVAAWAPAEAAEWMTDFEAAKAKAAQENKAVLVDFEHCLAKKNHIDVFLRDPTDEKIEIFNKLFPYDCFEFHDANKGISVAT